MVLISLSLILVINLFSFFFVISDNMVWLLAMLGLIQTGFILKISKENSPFNLFPLIMILWAIQFSLPTLISLIFEIPFKFNLSNEEIVKALALINVCQIFFVFLWKLPISGRLGEILPRPNLQSLKIMKPQLSILWAVSILFRLLMIFNGYQPGFDVERGANGVIENFMLIGYAFLDTVPLIYYFCLLDINSHKIIRYTILVIGIEIIINFFSGSKAGPVLLILSYLIAYNSIVKPFPVKRAYFILIICLVFIVPIYTIKSVARDLLMIQYSTTGIASERPVLGFIDYVFLYSDVLQSLTSSNIKENLTDTATALVYRFDTITTAAGVIRYYDNGNAHDLNDYLLLWIKPWIPRFIWEDKGWVGLGLFISNDILNIPSYTHSTPTSAIEGYIAGGFFGAIMLTLINVLFVKSAYIYFVKKRYGKDNSFLKAYFYTNFFIVLYFVQSYTFIRQIFGNLFIFLIIIFLLKLIRIRISFFKL